MAPSLSLSLRPSLRQQQIATLTLMLTAASLVASLASPQPAVRRRRRRLQRNLRRVSRPAADGPRYRVSSRRCQHRETAVVMAARR
jgi:hypothetical protein